MTRAARTVQSVTLALGLLLLLLLLAAGGCARREATPSPVSRRADLITAEELTRRAWTSVFDAIVELRPNWLHLRGQDTLNSTPGEIMVLMDGIRMGGTANLHSIPVNGISHIQFYNGPEASARWGLGYGKGAIYLVTVNARSTSLP